MKIFLFIIFLTSLSGTSKQEVIDNFYLAFASEDITLIDTEIRELDNLTTNSQIRAYQGALIMKRSSFEVTVKNKINMFKRGHALLENEITTSPDKIEYYFLRLAVQEHTPAILNYNSNIVEDKSIIIRAFSYLPTIIKKHILNYSKNSKILSISELQ